MGAFRWFFAISAIFSMTRSYELAFVLDIPQVVDNLKEMATNALTFPRAHNDDDMEAPSLSDRLRKMSWDVFSYMSTWLNSMSRRTNSNYEQIRPNVEVGPGVIKSEIVSYPPNYFVNRLKYLLKLKQKEEEDHTPPNKPEK